MMNEPLAGGGWARGGLRPDREGASALLPCPFCDARPALEASPWLDECFRIACVNGACGVRPRTEYLLARFADELRAAWNERPRDLRPLRDQHERIHRDAGPARTP